MKDHCFRQTGFTLIELMMVMSIILILSGGALAAYLSFNKSQVVGNDARNFASEIARVRSLSANLDYPAGCDSLKGYEVKSSLIDGELSGVTVTAKCSPAEVIFPVTQALFGSVFSAPFELVFLPGSGYLSTGDDLMITIQNKDDQSITKTVLIGLYGRITSS